MTTLQRGLDLPGTVRDGDPHLAYYDPAGMLSFVWTGTLTHPIHVQHGGYGEPTIALIDPRPLWTAAPEAPAGVLAWYRQVCETWAAAWDGHTRTGAPIRGRGGCTHRLGDGSLVCDNTGPHTPGHGCTYTSSTGSWVDDHHHDGGHG